MHLKLDIENLTVVRFWSIFLFEEGWICCNTFVTIKLINQHNFSLSYLVSHIIILKIKTSNVGFGPQNTRENVQNLHQSCVLQ